MRLHQLSYWQVTSTCIIHQKHNGGKHVKEKQGWEPGPSGKSPLFSVLNGSSDSLRNSNCLAQSVAISPDNHLLFLLGPLWSNYIRSRKIPFPPCTSGDARVQLTLEQHVWILRVHLCTEWIFLICWFIWLCGVFHMVCRLALVAVNRAYSLVVAASLFLARGFSRL